MRRIAADYLDFGSAAAMEFSAPWDTVLSVRGPSYAHYTFPRPLDSGFALALAALNTLKGAP